MPQFVVEALSERLGVPVVVKAESANPIGCFKGRGTWLAVEALVAALLPRLDGDSVVLVKGSRFMRMERVADALVAVHNPAPNENTGF